MEDGDKSEIKKNYNIYIEIFIEEIEGETKGEKKSWRARGRKATMVGYHLNHKSHWFWLKNRAAN